MNNKNQRADMKCIQNFFIKLKAIELDPGTKKPEGTGKTQKKYKIHQN